MYYRRRRNFRRRGGRRSFPRRSTYGWRSRPSGLFNPRPYGSTWNPSKSMVSRAGQSRMPNGWSLMGSLARQVKKLSRENNSEIKTFAHNYDWSAAKTISYLSTTEVPGRITAIAQGDTSSTRTGRSIKVVDMDVRVKAFANLDATYQQYDFHCAVIQDTRCDGDDGTSNLDSIWVNPGIRGTRRLDQKYDNSTVEDYKRYKVLYYKSKRIGPTQIGDPTDLRYAQTIADTVTNRYSGNNPTSEAYFRFRTKKWIHVLFQGTSATATSQSRNAVFLHCWVTVPDVGQSASFSYTTDALPYFTYQHSISYVDN